MIRRRATALLLRLALLHRRWREFATAYYRCAFPPRLLTAFDE